MAMLSAEGLPDAEALRDRAATVRAQSSCNCGCGSIYLVGDRDPIDLDEPPVVIVEGDVITDDGEVIGGLLLFEYDGAPHNLEVYSVVDEPLQLPSLDHVRLRASGPRN